jgi:hypothetical protein
VRDIAATLVALGLLVGACGNDAEGSDTGGGPATSLTITVTADEGATPESYELTCQPAGGNHPQPEQACAALEEAGAEVFEPVPEGQPCTMIYGGPQKAAVKGVVNGDKVDAAFNRANGCEIDRWETLGTTFFNVPLQ